MATIRPFRAWLADSEVASELTCPPYDVVSAAEARSLAENNEKSFLRVIRAEIDLPESTEPFSDPVYVKARQNLQAFQDAGWLRHSKKPRLFVYRLIQDDHQQEGVVACCAVDDYDHDLIRKHEKTRPDKENDRTQHMLALSAHPEAVILTYRDRADIDDMVRNICTQKPLIDFQDPDGVRHVLWAVDDSSALVEAFAAVPTLYVADGHHRSASASRAREHLRSHNQQHSGSEAYNFFPAAIFPARQLRILPYNRILQNIEEWRSQNVLRELRRRFQVRNSDSGVPEDDNTIKIYLDGQWYQIELAAAAGADPVAQLIVSRLQQKILQPLFGIVDQRTDKRVDFTGGRDGLERMQALVDQGKAQAAISLPPTSMQDLLAVSDAGELMPPKSTWFEPKLRSGLFLHSF